MILENDHDKNVSVKEICILCILSGAWLSGRFFAPRERLMYFDFSSLVRPICMKSGLGISGIMNAYYGLLEL